MSWNALSLELDIMSQPFHSHSFRARCSSSNRQVFKEAWLLMLMELMRHHHHVGRLTRGEERRGIRVPKNLTHGSVGASYVKINCAKKKLWCSLPAISRSGKKPLKKRRFTMFLRSLGCCAMAMRVLPNMCGFQALYALVNFWLTLRTSCTLEGFQWLSTISREKKETRESWDWVKLKILC